MGIQAGNNPHMVSITVFSDYVCPWCYIGTSELATLEGEYAFDVDWRPFLLRPDAPETGWPLPEHIRARMNRPDNPLTQRAQALGLTLVERAHIPSSRRAHECTEFARHHGKLREFHHGVIERYWSRGEDLSEWQVLKAAATDCGLDAEAMHRQVVAGDWRQATQQKLDEAVSIGVQAVPTFILGERFVIQGAQTASVFRQAFERLKSNVPI